MKVRLAEYGELAALFFLQSMAMGIWMVPLSRILDAQGYPQLRAYAYATSAIAAFISPLVFGAVADRHVSPVRVLRWLSAGSAATMALTAWMIAGKMPQSLVLLSIQAYAIAAAPTASIVATIVFSRLKDSQRQFGPIRAVATIGWIAGCWMVSAFRADASPLAGYLGSAAWLGLALFTYLLPAVPPPPGSGRTTFKERMGWDALALLKNSDHRVVFITAAAFSVPLAAFYPFTPLHLKQLGLERTAAWMSLGQVTEIVAMFALASLFANVRLKWIFGAGLLIGLIRYVMYSLDGTLWVLGGVTLHGASFTLFFITAQIYLNERIEAAWRARAQALMSMMMSGVGNLVGFLGTGFWLQTCSDATGTRWRPFWGVLAALIGLVLTYFLKAYHGQGIGLRRAGPGLSQKTNQ